MKKKLLISIILLAIICAVIIRQIHIIEENKVHPVERVTRDNNEQIEEARYIIRDGIRYEFLSYKVMTEEEAHQKADKYLKEHYYTGELPDLNSMVEVRDFESIKAECPELKDVWEDTTNKYTVEEINRIYNENIDIVDKYTKLVHIDKKYVFVKCRLTNTGTVSTEKYLNMLDVFVTDVSLENYLFQTDTLCYFDHAVNTQGDERKSFYAYTFVPNEELECILGFEIKDEMENSELYIGFTEVDLQVQGMNPALGKDVVKLSGNIEQIME